LLYHPEIEAAVCFISQEPLGDGRQESPPDSLSGALGNDMKVVQKRPVGWVLIWKNTREAGQIRFCFREDGKKRFRRLFCEPRLPYSRPFGMGAMV
jgi:hypothetical protein